MPGVISSMKKDKAGHRDGDHWSGGAREAKPLSRDLKKRREEARSEPRQEGSRQRDRVTVKTQGGHVFGNVRGIGRRPL